VESNTINVTGIQTSSIFEKKLNKRQSSFENLSKKSALPPKEKKNETERNRKEPHSLLEHKGSNNEYLIIE